MKGTLVLLGDSFTNGDGNNSEYIMRECFSPQWISDADELCMRYHQDQDQWAEQFGELQQEYITEANRFGFTPVKDSARWSNVVAQHTGLEVFNLGVSGNSVNGILITLSQWLNNRQKSAEPVCVMANFAYLNRLSFVSTLQENGDPGDPNTLKIPHNLLVRYDVHDPDISGYFERYDRLRGYEFDFYHTLWLCGVLCETHDVSFVWSGPREFPLSSLDNSLNFPIKHNRNISTIIPEFTDIINYHKFCAQDSEKNPLSLCGHYNEYGQALMGRELSRKLLENEDWLFEK